LSSKNRLKRAPMAKRGSQRRRNEGSPPTIISPPNVVMGILTLRQSKEKRGGTED